MKQRIEYLDIAKGILILLMLVGHVWDDGPVHRFIYAFHMPAFFLISGLLFRFSSAGQQPLWRVILRKAKALLVPYLCFELYGILVQVLTEGAYLNIKGYLFQLLTFTLTNGPLWFLIVLFVSEVLFLCMQCVLKGRFSVCVIVALFIASLLMPRFQAYISPTTILFALLFLWIGYSFQSQLCKRSIPAAVLSLFIVLVLSQINVVDISNYQAGIVGVFHLTALAGSYLVLCVSQLLRAQLLLHYGKNSLIVLGTHFPINRAVKHYLKIEHFSTWNGCIYLLLQLAYELVFIFVINRYLPFILGRWYSPSISSQTAEQPGNVYK